MVAGENLARLALLSVVLYCAALFGLAHLAQRAGIPPRWSRALHILSLSVYCSSWTFFGAVGSALTNGWSYATIYIGPMLVFLLAPGFLDRLTAKARGSGSTSISDFISSQYGRSRSISAIVTLGALVASIPYVALQLRSVTSTFAALVGSGAMFLPTSLVALALGIFSIIFGARHFSASGRNDGLIAAIGAESLFKLLSFGALGLYALLILRHAPGSARPPSSAIIGATHAPGLDAVTRIILSALAVLCLPRQFHVGVTEARATDSLRSARWGFVLYLALMVTAALPIAFAGMAFLPAGTAVDLVVLDLPLSRGSWALALLAFLGGFSAATAMVITETIALSTMVSNDLVAPLLMLVRRSEREADLGRFMLTVRRLVILAIIGIALIYAQAIGQRHNLMSIGLIAFAGVAQFGPALIAAVALDFHDKRAARAGLVAGLFVWIWSLLLPSVHEGQIAEAVARATQGWIDPRAPLGFDLGTPLATAGLASLAVNILAMLLVHGAHLFNRRGHFPHVERGFRHVASLGDLEALVARFVGEAEAAESFVPLRETGHGGQEPMPISGEAARIAERLIARVIGGPSARLIVTSSMAGGTLEVGDVVRLLDQNEQNLQFSRTLLAATLEAIDVGVSVIDSNLRLIAWNPRYLEMFEYPDGMVKVGRPIADLIRYNAERGDCGPGEVEAHVERRLAHLRRGLPHRFERRRPNGRWIATTGRAMPGGGYVQSFTDITAEKERQRELEEHVAARTRDLAAINLQLRAAKAAAEEATQDKTRFLAAASHDLLQPLHAARLFCSALGREARPEQASLIRRMDGAIQSADMLLRALLDVSKLDSGGVQPHYADIDLAQLVGGLLTECAAVAVERGIGLSSHIGHYHVRSDAALLRSILQNLLSNALRYTPAGGRIWIGARRRRGRIRVEVRDSGVGIAEADQQRIFAEFVRLDSARAHGGGVGLGLAIVKRAAQLLDLSIDLRSRAGAGSTFAISLPEASGTLSVTAQAPHEAAAARPGPPPDMVPHILCLDDDARILDAIVTALAARGCIAHPCATAEAAIDLAHHVPLDAAFLDLHLGPGEDQEDGLDVAQELRTMNPRLPIAIVTADQSVEQDFRFASLGLVHLSKPGDPERMWRFLADALGVADTPAPPAPMPVTPAG